jgi:hypothetical protein
MTANANSERSKAAGGFGVRLEKGQDRAGVGVVARKFLRDFQGVAPVGSGLVVGEDGAGGLEFVVDLRNGDEEAVPGEKRGGAADGARDLKDFGVKEYARVFPFRDRAEEMRSHRAGWGRQIDKFVIFDDHKIAPEKEAKAMS